MQPISALGEWLPASRASFINARPPLWRHKATAADRGKRLRARYTASYQPQPDGYAGRGRAAVGQVVERTLTIFSTGHLDPLIELLHSDELLLSTMLPSSREEASYGAATSSGEVEASEEPPASPLWHLLDAMQQHSPALHLMDSCAIRTLILQRPRSIQKLEGMWLSPSRFAQRVLVEAPTGEEAVLTLTLVKQGPSCSPSDRPLRSAGLWPTSPDISSSVAGAVPPKHSPPRAGPMDRGPAGTGGGWWSLCSITGEALHPVLPTSLSPEFGPEAVVKSQVDALRRGDLGRAYALLSPNSQQLLGGVDNFRARMLSKRSPYLQLLGHSHASSVRRCHSGRDTYMEVQMVEGPLGSADEPGQVHLWCWVLKLQEGSETGGILGGQEQGQGSVEDCWAIESVVQVPQEALQ